MNMTTLAVQRSGMKRKIDHELMITDDEVRPLKRHKSDTIQYANLMEDEPPREETPTLDYDNDNNDNAYHEDEESVEEDRHDEHHGQGVQDVQDVQDEQDEYESSSNTLSMTSDDRCVEHFNPDIIQGLEHLIPSRLFNPFYQPNASAVLAASHSVSVSEAHAGNDPSVHFNCDTESISSHCTQQSTLSEQHNNEHNNEHINSLCALPANYSASHEVLDQLYHERRQRTESMHAVDESGIMHNDDEDNGEKGNTEGGGGPSPPTPSPPPSPPAPPHTAVERRENDYTSHTDEDEDEDEDDDDDMHGVDHLMHDHDHQHQQRQQPPQVQVCAAAQDQTDVIELLSDDTDDEHHLQSNGHCKSNASDVSASCEATATATAAAAGGGDDDDHAHDADDGNYEQRTHTQSNGGGGGGEVCYRKQDEYLRYPHNAPQQVIISIGDLGRLRPLTFLNDSLIDFYLKYMYREVLDEQQRRDTYIFNQFFFTKLNKAIVEGNDTARLKLAKWTKNVDIFAKKLLIIPVNQSCHWSLVVVTHPGHCVPLNLDAVHESSSTSTSSSTVCKDMLYSLISRDVFMEPAWVHTLRTNAKVRAVQQYPCKILHFDSMRGCHTTPHILNTLRTYLSDEWQRRRTHVSHRTFDCNAIPGISLGVPQQSNATDCGVFLLHFAELFALQPFYDGGGSVSGRYEWFARNNVTHKRADIKHLCMVLRSKQGQPHIDIDAVLDSLQITVESQSGLCLHSATTPHKSSLHSSYPEYNNHNAYAYRYTYQQGEEEEDDDDEEEESISEFEEFEESLWDTDEDHLKRALVRIARNDPHLYTTLRDIIWEEDYAENQ